MSLDNYDKFSLYDPNLREAVLYELEMLHPPPATYQREPRISLRPREFTPADPPPLVVESSLAPVEGDGQVVAAPSAQRKSGGRFLWIAMLVIVLLGGVIVSLARTAEHPTSSSTTATASQALVRIAQLDERQYATADEYSIWAYSSCSAAAMAEVINAYEAVKKNHTTYRLTDILQMEEKEGQITADLGLLNGLTSIQKTVAHFGYKASELQSATLEQLVQTAQAGKPVIVGFRDPYWFPTGHLPVVRGGDNQTVYLADSSRLNWTKLSRKEFMALWTGVAYLVEPA